MFDKITDFILNGKGCDTWWKRLIRVLLAIPFILITLFIVISIILLSPLLILLIIGIALVFSLILYVLEG